LPTLKSKVFLDKERLIISRRVARQLKPSLHALRRQKPGYVLASVVPSSDLLSGTQASIKEYTRLKISSSVFYDVLRTIILALVLFSTEDMKALELKSNGTFGRQRRARFTERTSEDPVHRTIS